MTPVLDIFADAQALFFGPSLAPVAWSVAAVAVAAGALSPMVVMNRMAFFTDAVAHASLLGVGIGLLMGSANQLWPMLAVAFAVGGGVWWLRRATGQSADTLLGVLMTGSLALGVLIYIQSGSPRDLHSYLFGDIATLPREWFPGIAAASAVVLVASILLFNRLALIAVSEDLVRARGIRTAWAEILLVALLCVVVTLGVRTLGILMVNALLVIPGAFSRLLVGRLAGYFWVSVAASVVSAIIGLTISYGPGWPPGPSVVLVLVSLFLLGVCLRPLLRRRRP